MREARGKWIAGLRPNKRKGMAKPRSVRTKRADSQARSGSFWFLVAEFSLGLKRLGGLSREKVGWSQGYFVGLAIL